MGADMVTMTLPLPLGSAPDWDAAAHAIRDVRLAVLSDTGDLYDWERWLEDTTNLPGAVAAFKALRAAQTELHGHACLLRGAIEHGWPDELIELETPTHRLWITGGPSWGEPPGDLAIPVILLAESGATDAAGFEGYTPYEEPSIPQRRLGFSTAELRLTRLGVAAAHAAEEAAGLEHPAADGPASTWFAAWRAELPAVGGTEGDRALLRFAARGLALSAWLKDPSAVRGSRLDERACDLALIADEGGLLRRPRRRSRRVIADELLALVDELGPRVAQLDDPTAHQREDVRWFIENAGGTFGDALEIEVAAHSLFAAVAALVDLYGDDVAQLMDVPPAAISSEAPSESETRFAPLRQYLSVILVGDIDWPAAERAVETLEQERREERRTDLAELRRLIATKEYRRFATRGEAVGAHRIYVTAPHGNPDQPDIASGIGRLGRDGVLDAAGVIRWSAPDPGYHGPVESYVSGYGPWRLRTR